MGNKKTSAPASAKGREVDLSIPNLSTTALRACHRRHLEDELGSKRAVQLALNAKFEIFDMCDEIYSFLELI